MCIWNVSSCLHGIHLFHGWSCDTDIVNEQNRSDRLLVTVLTISSSPTLSWNCFVMKPSRPHSSRSKYLSGIVVNKYVSWRRADYCWYNMVFNWKRLAVIVFSNGASLGILNERNLRKLYVTLTYIKTKISPVDGTRYLYIDIYIIHSLKYHLPTLMFKTQTNINQ